MREYIVYRHGREPVTEGEAPVDRNRRPVARIFADDPEQACRMADASVEEGQWLTAEPAEEVDARVNEIGLRQEGLSEADDS